LYSTITCAAESRYPKAPWKTRCNASITGYLKGDCNWAKQFSFAAWLKKNLGNRNQERNTAPGIDANDAVSESAGGR
jgi:hypothetical protein